MTESVQRIWRKWPGTPPCVCPNGSEAGFTLHWHKGSVTPLCVKCRGVWMP